MDVDISRIYSIIVPNYSNYWEFCANNFRLSTGTEGLVEIEELNPDTPIYLI